MAPWGPKGAQGFPKSDFGDIWVSLWEPSGNTFGVILPPKIEIGGDYVDFLVPFFRSLKKERKRGSPGGDMRSAHAGACFVRVGPRRFGSILGSVLESF